MHPQAHDYVRQTLDGLTFDTAVEVGGRNINGTVRDVVNTDVYIAVDVVDGKGVDVVADATTWKPDVTPDVVICCEVLEHAEQWGDLVDAMASWLDDGGLLVITCATGDRTPHSAVDGAQLRPDEYYRNVPKTTLVRQVEQAGLTVEDVQVRDKQDLYLTARR